MQQTLYGIFGAGEASLIYFGKRARKPFEAILLAEQKKTQSMKEKNHLYSCYVIRLKFVKEIQMNW